MVEEDRCDDGVVVRRTLSVIREIQEMGIKVIKDDKGSRIRTIDASKNASWSNGFPSQSEVTSAEQRHM